MKKIILLMLACLLSFSLTAQQELTETKVEPPYFSGQQFESNLSATNDSHFCCYLEKKIVYPEEIKGVYQEGVVIVEFSVEADASISNLKVINSVCYELDEAVINCVKRTNGLWTPGKVNGIYSPMEKTVAVKFDLLDTATLNELATSCYNTAVKRYNKGISYKENTFLTETKSYNKAKRRFNWSLKHLDIAMKYKPNDPSIIFWQANNYRQLGDYTKMNEKLEKFHEIVNSQSAPDNLEIAIINR